MSQRTDQRLRFINSLRRIQPHNHVCMIYDSFEEKMEAAALFFQIGFEEGDKCLFIGDEETAEQIKRELQQEGFDIASKIKTGAFRVKQDHDIYFGNAKFDPNEVIHLISEEVSKALACGFRALRVVGEISGVISKELDKELLIKYESRVCNLFDNSECQAICLYNRSYYAPKTILDVIRIHPTIIYQNRVCRNFYFDTSWNLESSENEKDVQRMLGHIGEYNEIVEALQYRIEFERLIMDLSTEFIKLRPDEIDKGLDKALKRIGEFSHVDRSYVFLIDRNKNMMSNTHEWCSPGIEPQMNRLQHLPIDQFPWIMGEINDLKTAHVPRVVELSDEAHQEKKQFQSEGIQSLICVPMRLGNSAIGFIGFDSVREEKSWSDDDIALLKIFSEIFANALLRKQTEKAIVQSEMRYRDLVDNINDFIWRIDANGIIKFVNTAVERVMGYRPEDLHDKHIQTVLTEESYQKAKASLESHLRGELDVQVVTLELTFLGKNGKEIVGESRTMPIYNSKGELIEIEGVIRDITDRKKVEKALQESQRTLSTLMSNLPGMAYRCHNDGKWTMEFVSEGCLELTGYYTADLIHNQKVSYGKIIIPEDRRGVWNQVQKAVKNNTSFEIIYRIKTAAGQIKHVLEKGHAIPSSTDPQFFFLEGFISDVTGLKRMEEEQESLRRLSQKLTEQLTFKEICKIAAAESRRLFDHDAFWLGLYSETSRNLEEIYMEDIPENGNEPVEVKEQRSYKVSYIVKPHIINRTDTPKKSHFVPFGNTSRLSNSLMFVPIRWENKIIGDISVQSYMVNKYGDRELRLLQIFADQCGSAFSRVRAEQKQARLEEQLQQSQKMEAIGQLAGGVSHDFNNLLTGIIGNLNLAEMKAPPELHKFLMNAKNAADRAANLVQQLLAFSRKSIVELKPVDLNRVVDEVSRLAQQIIDRRIEIAVDSDKNIPKVYADSTQINSVLMNLCINARDAIQEIIQGYQYPDRRDDKFIIQIRTGIRQVQKDDVQMESVVPAQYVHLSVQDNGIGMNEDTQRRIFEPFFTTKEVGKGTGLGLASVYGIITQHQGWIETDSVVGKGTTFSIYLPAREKERGEENTNNMKNVTKGEETILFIDDEELIRNLAQSALENYGYRVLLASNGEQALKIFKDEKERIDLIILDLSMPELSGREVLERIRSMDKEIKVIVSSGYSDSSQIEPLMQYGVAEFITKPYRPAYLANKIHDVIDSSEG